MKKVTILLTKEIMKANPIFNEHGFSAGTKVTIVHGGEEDKAASKLISTDPQKPRPDRP